ncbi:hypothetical protein C1I95_34320, partial [Micromonospora craterilacus]
MSDVEDDYVDLYEDLLDNSEFAAGEPGKRFDFDSATWAISVLSSVLTIVGTSLGPSLRVSKDWAGNEEVPSDQGKWDLLRVRVSCHGRHLLGEG